MQFIEPPCRVEVETRACHASLIVTDDTEAKEQALESAREQAALMTTWQLFNWVDDMDKILASMPVQAREAYYTAHRVLVVEAMMEDAA